ncbi:carbon-nitrogen hydrolase family protein [Geodermatophilus sp. SYSU D00703]
MLTVAVAQFLAGPDAEKNLRRVEELTAEAAAQGADLVVFPEASMYAWDVPAPELVEAAQRDVAAFTAGLGAAAARHAVTLVAGVFAPRPGAQPFNRMVVVGADGRPQGSYDKLHLYDAFAWRESEKVSAGSLTPDGTELCVVPIGEFTIGLLNCYDLRFPEMARALVDRGADVLVVSSAWVAGPHKEMHWETLLRARAIENTCYVLASNQPPPASVGLSTVIDPFGLVAATCPTREGIAVHSLDPAHLRDVRQTVPSLAHRRYRVTAPHSEIALPHPAASPRTPESEETR